MGSRNYILNPNLLILMGNKTQKESISSGFRNQEEEIQDFDNRLKKIRKQQERAEIERKEELFKSVHKEALMNLSEMLELGYEFMVKGDIVTTKLKDIKCELGFPNEPYMIKVRKIDGRIYVSARAKHLSTKCHVSDDQLFIILDILIHNSESIYWKHQWKPIV